MVSFAPLNPPIPPNDFTPLNESTTCISHDGVAAINTLGKTVSSKAHIAEKREFLIKELSEGTTLWEKGNDSINMQELDDLKRAVSRVTIELSQSSNIYSIDDALDFMMNKHILTLLEDNPNLISRSADIRDQLSDSMYAQKKYLLNFLQHYDDPNELSYQAPTKAQLSKVFGSNCTPDTHRSDHENDFMRQKIQLLSKGLSLEPDSATKIYNYFSAKGSLISRWLHSDLSNLPVSNKEQLVNALFIINPENNRLSWLKEVIIDSNNLNGLDLYKKLLTKLEPLLLDQDSFLKELDAILNVIQQQPDSLLSLIPNDMADMALSQLEDIYIITAPKSELEDFITEWLESNESQADSKLRLTTLLNARDPKK